MNFDVEQGRHLGWMLSYIADIYKVFLQYEFSDAEQGVNLAESLPTFLTFIGLLSMYSLTDVVLHAI